MEFFCVYVYVISIYGWRRYKGEDGEIIKKIWYNKKKYGVCI